MERSNIHKTITELFDGRYNYIVPLYQRNFAWGDQEITQLLQDLYENFDTKTPYFVGSLIYIRRKSNSTLEVIDGQQRLTVMTLLLNVLGKDLLPDLFASRLEYDSREEVSSFLKQLYSPLKSYDNNAETSEIINTFKAAYSTLEDAPLSVDDERITIRNLKNTDIQRLSDFARYIKTNVFFVLAEMPQDTDVASYFEIMNNTGDQLRKHEIVKSLILASAKRRGLSIAEMESLAIVWDVCSQMDLRVQGAFSANKRALLFGENYDSFLPQNITRLMDDANMVEDIDDNSLDVIISDSKYNISMEMTSEEDDNVENKGNAIIDFPNFLMHILRLCYNEEYKRHVNDDIPLNEKDLLKVYRVIESDVDPIQFIAKLLYYRIVFDRYIVRINGDESENKWELMYLKKHRDKNGVYPVNTFGKEAIEDKNNAIDKVIKALSMLQVSYPQRKYKRFLNAILSWFEYGIVKYEFDWFMTRLNRLILSYIKDIETEYGDNIYCLGTNTPRFVLNVIDYLYYLDGADSNFDFKYYNSVEHHLPQSRENYNRISKEVLDSLGNLFLLSRRANSSLNDGDPIAKADKSASIINTLPPNRKYIYMQTLSNRRWYVEDIAKHEQQIRKLFAKKEDLLNVRELEEGPLLYRACLAIADYCDMSVGNSKYGLKYNFKDLSGEVAKESLNYIIGWLNTNPGKGLEEFIEEQLKTNRDLINDSWRYCFVKYPSVINFCQLGNFTWNRDGREVYLLPQNQVVKYARELHCHIFVEKACLPDYKIDINQSGIWILLDDTRLMSLYLKAYVRLHLWISDDGNYWCYEICSERGANARENIALVKNGWMKNDNGNYFLSDRQYLCKCPDDYEAAVKLALDNYLVIVDKINKIRS